MRKLIEKTEYVNGAFLPREVELSKILGVSRNTVRQATNKLEMEGLIIRKKGVGTKVASKRISTNLAEWHSFTQEMTVKGIPFKNLEVSVEWVLPDEKTRNFLNVGPKTEILKLARLKGTKNEPMVYFESFFQPRIGLTGEEDFNNRPLYDILEKDYHSIPAISKENISAGVAGKYHEKLKTAEDFPILIRERFVSDPGSRPLEYNIGFYRADKFTYNIEIRK